jgi:hypothetical protein
LHAISIVPLSDQVSAKGVTLQTVSLYVLASVLAGVLPLHGTVVPGKSLGGLRLGDSPAHVVATWGRKFGVCAGCARTTWYYNYTAYEPQGAGVAFAGRHVIQLFTLWSPTGWRTEQGLRTGDPATRITTFYGRLHGL